MISDLVDVVKDRSRLPLLRLIIASPGPRYRGSDGFRHWDSSDGFHHWKIAFPVMVSVTRIRQKPALAFCFFEPSDSAIEIDAQRLTYFST
jgi:hypothetical protein